MMPKPKNNPPAGGKKSWQARLNMEADAITAAFLASLDVDSSLWQYDIAGSIAHARMLKKIGLLTAGEFSKIEKGLMAIARDIDAGKLDMPVELEDIHMVIEKALISRTGLAGMKLHTGRSRNDQVATDLRLWARHSIHVLSESLRDLQRAFVEMADRHGQIIMPAYTHMQRAQPTLAGQSLLAYVEMLDRDHSRLADALKRLNVCPLGSGAVAGTSLPLDRRMTAGLLGFDGITRNSIDATSDRDFLADLCYCCAMIAIHLSRWAEDWIIQSSNEFGFIELSDAYCTSSSMMPQKKNADTLELIRAKGAGAIGGLAGLLSLLKGLPLAYNRDLQDDKRFAMPVVEAVHQAMVVARGIVSTAKFNRKHIESDLNAGFLDATSMAEYLVGKGVPFRKAHQIVGRLVAAAENNNKHLAELPMPALKAACEKFDSDVHKYLGATNVIRRYRPEGSAGLTQLKKQLAHWKRVLK